MTDRDVIRALDGARRVGWAKYYDRKQAHAAVVEMLSGVLTSYIRSSFKAELPVTPIWDLIDRLEINEYWVYELPLGWDVMEWFRTGQPDGWSLP